MATAYESAYHIAQVRLRGGLPSTDARFTDAKLLKLLTDELQGNIAPLIHNAKADHGVVQYTVSATVGTATYNVPDTAFANTMRDVYWIDSSNNITPLDPRSSADPLMYALSQTNGTPKYYSLRGSRVVLAPPPAAAGTLALPHYARPNRLVLIAEAARSTVVSYGSGILNVTVSSAAASTLQSATTFDLVRSLPGFETLKARVAGTWLTSTTFRVTGLTEDPGFAVGDYICLPGESPVPQCPVELFPLLYARAALVAVPSAGDMSQASAALAAQVADLEAKATAFLRPRVESAQPPPGRGFGSNPLLDTLSGSWNSGY